jgi:signal transduction histidine kinase/CheY-like chemotaxis protein/HPt (histidine-containing phosphotransfer) domain-containing protein
MLLYADILQSMRQSGNLAKVFQEITTKLLNLVQVDHVAIYHLDRLTSDRNETGINGKIVAEAIAPSCELCTQEKIENILKEEYQWGQDITKQIIDLYTAEVSRCEINFAEIFAGKAYLLVPIVLSEREVDRALWGFLILHQCVVLDGESLQGAWDQDDVLMLQQIAMQIEITLLRKPLNDSSLEQVQEFEQAYATLLHWAEQYRALVENIPSTSYVSPISNTLEFAYMSPQLRELLGVPVAEWNIECFYSWAKHLYVEDCERVQQELRKTIETGVAFSCEYRMVTHSNKIIWVQDNAEIGLATDHKTRVLCGTIFDISDRKAIEQALQKSESLLVESQRVAKVGNWELNVVTKEIVWSAELFNIFDRDIALGVPTFEEAVAYYAPEDQQKICQAINRTMDTGESYYLELRLAQPDRYLETHGHAEFNDQGEIIRLYGTAQDITDRKLTEAKLTAAQIAEAQNKSKTEFLSVMSHELRTPMNAVIGMTEILQRTSLSRQQQQYVNTILQGGEVLLSVINNILDFSRIESGHFELEEKPFRLHQCIEEVLELIASRTAEKFIELIPFISLDVPQQLLGDSTRLRQIIINLVGNAIKFTDAGEIVIAVNSQLIDLETNTYELQFEVHDTGVGIAPEAIAKLFKAFSQANSSIAGQYGGTGLGLVICKQLCELMGGEIGVSSNVGDGSTFSFTIRAQAIIEDLDATNAIAPELKGKSILCVNPNATLQQAISLYAQPWEMTIQTAYNASEALQLLAKFDFDAVLIDRQLVETDGSAIDVLELARTIQEIFPDIHLILLTPINVVLNEKNNPTCFKDFITKPISTSKLYQAFLNVFTNQKATRFSPQNPQPFCETNNIVDDENFAKCYPFQILIAEDNPVNQRILLLMLENLGYQADVVDNGQKAINKFLSRSYDLIFMDIQMPIMSGLDATRNIRQTSNYQPRIIGLSANAFSESRDSALNAGMDDYLTKPLQIKSLIAALQKIPQQQQLFVDHSQPPIELSTLASIENSVGTENLDGLINLYLDHSAGAIAKMKEAFTKQDFATIEAESHTLKGGSGNFGAIQLSSSCRAIQSMCAQMIEANEYAREDVTKVASLLKNIEEQYNYVCQTLGTGQLRSEV